MIVSVTTPKSLMAKLEYDFKQENKEKSTLIYSQGVSVGSDGYPNIEVAYTEIMAQIPENVRTKNIVFAASLNPDPREYLSDEQLMLIAREFMERMGYGKQPFIVTRHHDIEREHIHILSTRVRPDGKKIPDKYEGQEARSIIDSLEVKYGLILSPKNAQKQNKKEVAKRVYGLYAEPIRVGKANIFEQTRSVLRRILPESKFQSIGEFNALLAKYNLKAEITKTEYKGKIYEGIAYAPIDNKGQVAGKPISGSELGRGFGLSAVQNRMRKSKPLVAERIPHFIEVLQSTMEKRPATIEDFKRQLADQGIRPMIFQNEKGRIYGVTFVEDNTNTAINGSKIGKEFSANAFNDYFSPETQTPLQIEEKLEQIEANADSSITLTSWTTGNDDGRDYTEEAFARRMKRLYGTKKPRRPKQK